MPNDKRLNEEAVRRQLSLVTSVINSIPDLILYKDLEGVYLGGNKALSELIGRPIDEIVGKTDFDLFPENVAKFFRKKDQEMLASRHTSRNDEWVDYPDGRHVLLDTLKTPLFDEHGKLCGLLGIRRDITGREFADGKAGEPPAGQGRPHSSLLSAAPLTAIYTQKIYPFKMACISNR